jgi:hypothetical protein
VSDLEPTLAELEPWWHVQNRLRTVQHNWTHGNRLAWLSQQQDLRDYRLMLFTQTIAVLGPSAIQVGEINVRGWDQSPGAAAIRNKEPIKAVRVV